MNIHKHTRLIMLDRNEIWQLSQTRLWKMPHLTEHFQLGRFINFYNTVKPHKGLNKALDYQETQ
jgi:hypothetical protein